MPLQKMTVKEYAALREIGDSAVRRAIKFGFRMPGVEKREKFGNAHVLHVDIKKVKKAKAAVK